MDLAGKLAPRVSRDFPENLNRETSLDHVTVKDGWESRRTTDVSLCRQRDRHSKHPRNDVDRLNPIRPTHCGRVAITRQTGRVSWVHRYQPIPGPESTEIVSLVFAWPSRIRKPGGDMSNAVNADIPVAGGSWIRGGGQKPQKSGILASKGC
jgi:hypothetical protein